MARLKKFFKELPILEAMGLKWFIWTALITLILVLFFTYIHATEYRSIMPRFGGSELTIETHQPEVTFLLGTKEIGVSEEGQEKIVYSGISKETKAVYAIKPGYLPWGKTINFEDYEKVTINPFLLPHTADSLEVSKDTKEFDSIRSMAFEYDRPTKENPLESMGGKQKVWLEKNKVVVSWSGQVEERPEYFCTPECSSLITVFEPIDPIRTVYFYKDRDDVLVASLGEGVYVFEIDTRFNQNMHPLYGGDIPRFVSTDQQTGYVVERDQIFKINL